MIISAWTGRRGQDKPKKWFLAKSDKYFSRNQKKKNRQGQGHDYIFVKVTLENYRKIAVFGIKLLVVT